MLMSWLSVIATMLNWITSLQRKIQWSRWSMIAIESEFKLSRGYFLRSFCFCLTTFIIFFSISFSRVCVCQVIFFIMWTLVAVIIAMIAQQKSVNDHLFSGAFFGISKHTYTYFIINFDRLKISFFLFILLVKAI